MPGMDEDALLAELARIRLRYAERIDEALGRLMAWAEEHPDGEDEVEQQPEYREVLRLADAEIREVAALLAETLPALTQRERAGGARTQQVAAD
jgi:hypothetical protein